MLLSSSGVGKSSYTSRPMTASAERSSDAGRAGLEGGASSPCRAAGVGVTGLDGMPSSPSPHVPRLRGVDGLGGSTACNPEDEETMDDLRPHEMGVLLMSLNDGECNMDPTLSGVRGSRSSSHSDSADETVVAEKAETTDKPL